MQLLHATNCMQLYSARRPSGAKTITWNNCMQQLHAIVLGSGRDYRCNQCVTGDVICEMSSDEELLLLSRDSIKRCHWLQHFGLMNIFEHVCMKSLQLLHATIAARCMQ